MIIDIILFNNSLTTQEDGLVRNIKQLLILYDRAAVISRSKEK